MSTNNPTTPSVDVISVVERSCSVFSLLGCIFIIGTFCLDKAFRKPINRLVFYASFGNLMTNVATLMAKSFIENADSPGCQFQAFMIQMFMPADALWTMAMALNVYLTFYHKFDAQRLRKMDVAYLVSCYGIPFVIALTYIFISTPERGRFYGNATLWCWVSPQWDIFRIATFYGPVWIVTLVTFAVYLRAGSDIYKRHKQLRDFSSTTHHDAETTSPASMGDSFRSTKTTEVLVTTEVVDQDAMGLAHLGGPSSGLRRGSQSSSSMAAAATTKPPSTAAAYSVTISSNSNKPAAPDRQSYSLPIQGNSNNSNTTTTSPIDRPQTASRNATTTNPSNSNPRRRAAYEANSAILSYTKCALLFFTAMLVTWIPSSANRVFSVVHDGQTSTTLEIMSAAVLPLQGFWNAIIYAVTSWKAVKMLFNGQGNLINGEDGGGLFRSRSWSNGRNLGNGMAASSRRGGTGPKIQELMGVRTFQGIGSGGGGGRGGGATKLPGSSSTTASSSGAGGGGTGTGTEKKKPYNPYGFDFGYNNYGSTGSSESMTELARSITGGTSTRPSSNERDRDRSRDSPSPLPSPSPGIVESPIPTRF